MSDYSAEKIDSEKRDLELGFRIAAVELEVSARLARGEPANRQTWNHLSPQIFQTPYAEFERIVRAVDPDSKLETFVDLGAAYGRLGIVLAELRPSARFLGIELVPERVAEGRRVYAEIGLDPNALVTGDLARDPLPIADTYFIYDFGKRQEIERVLAELRKIAVNRIVRVVGRGRGIRDIIERENPWLASIVAPIHTAHYSIYRSG